MSIRISWRVVSLLVGLGVPLPTTGIGSPQSPAPASTPGPLSATSQTSPAKDTLEREKLRAEIAKLTVETDVLTHPYQQPTFITTIVGLLTVIGGALKFVSDRRKEREKDIDDHFGEAIGLLGNERPEARAAGAVAIALYADKRYGNRGTLVVKVLLSQLSLKPPEAEQRVLVDSLSRAMALVGNLPGLAAQEADLSHVHVGKGVSLDGADFTDALLRDARFIDVSMKRSTFDRANATGAKFDRSALDGTTFSAATLERTTFVGANLTGVVFSEIEFSYCSFDDVTSMAKVRFEKCKFTGTTFAGTSLEGAMFENTLYSDEKTRKSVAGAKGNLT